MASGENRSGIAAMNICGETNLLWLVVFVVCASGAVAEESSLQQHVDPGWKNEH